MSEYEDRVTAFSADLYEAAELEGARHSRSARQQLDYWSRVGQAVTSARSAERAKVVALLTGKLPWTELSEHEATLANAEVCARISLTAAHLDMERALGGDGVPTVALDD